MKILEKIKIWLGKFNKSHIIEDKNKLAQEMVEPIRKALDYQGVGKKLLMIEPLPQITYNKYSEAVSQIYEEMDKSMSVPANMMSEQVRRAQEQLSQTISLPNLPNLTMNNGSQWSLNEPNRNGSVYTMNNGSTLYIGVNANGNLYSPSTSDNDSLRNNIIGTATSGTSILPSPPTITTTATSYLNSLYFPNGYTSGYTQDISRIKISDIYINPLLEAEEDILNNYLIFYSEHKEKIKLEKIKEKQPKNSIGWLEI